MALVNGRVGWHGGGMKPRVSLAGRLGSTWFGGGLPPRTRERLASIAELRTHWSWACDRLSRAQLDNLVARTRLALRLANRAI